MAAFAAGSGGVDGGGGGDGNGGAEYDEAADAALAAALAASEAEASAQAGGEEEGDGQGSGAGAAGAVIYHEPQDSQLCGQHCLNNLLQRQRFSPGDLASVAQELDERERQFMLEAGATTGDALRFLAEDSSNVDETGNFSIQVLREALQRAYGVTLDSWTSVDVREGATGSDPTLAEGIVCNRNEHWFAIRKINGRWWNLNSLNSVPQLIGGFFLSAFLGQLREEGYSVFLAQGDLPPPSRGNPGPVPGSSSVRYAEEDLLAIAGAMSPEAESDSSSSHNSAACTHPEPMTTEPTAIPSTDATTAAGTAGAGIASPSGGDADLAIAAILSASAQEEEERLRRQEADEEEQLARAMALSMETEPPLSAATAQTPAAAAPAPAPTSAAVPAVPDRLALTPLERDALALEPPPPGSPGAGGNDPDTIVTIQFRYMTSTQTSATVVRRFPVQVRLCCILAFVRQLMQPDDPDSAPKFVLLNGTEALDVADESRTLSQAGLSGRVALRVRNIVSHDTSGDTTVLT